MLNLLLFVNNLGLLIDLFRFIALCIKFFLWLTILILLFSWDFLYFSLLFNLCQTCVCLNKVCQVWISYWCNSCVNHILQSINFCSIHWTFIFVLNHLIHIFLLFHLLFFDLFFLLFLYFFFLLLIFTLLILLFFYITLFVLLFLFLFIFRIGWFSYILFWFICTIHRLS